MTKVRLLIDGDIVRTRCAAACEHKEYILYAKGEEDAGPLKEFPYVDDYKAWMKKKGYTMDDITVDVRTIVEPKHFGFHMAKQVIDRMLNIFDTDNFNIYLTASPGYRKMFVPEYKANRKNQERPIWEKAIQDYLVRHYGAQVVTWYEADDLMAIEQMRDPDEDTIICTNDKDLWMVPGKHFDFTVEDAVVEDTTEEMGRYMFWYQMLVGDTADNVKGVPGVGPKKAEKVLDGCGTETEYYLRVRGEYIRKFGPETGDQELLYCATALWMLREEHGYWEPPTI